MVKSARNVCFTWFDYSDQDIENCKNWDCKYLCIGFETCPSTGKKHIQGYVEWKGSKRFDTLKNINTKIHWENRKGTAKQAAEYCKKDGNFYEKGEISNQGNRTDLEEVSEMLKKKKSLKEIVENFPVVYIKYHKGIEKMQNILMPQRTTRPIVTWLWGKTGVGKTYKAVNSHKDYYIKPKSKWWDGYTQQECIIIDDFDGDWPYRDLLRVLDTYGYQGQTKGGHVEINSPFIYITSEYHPNHFWTDSEYSQMIRRIANVQEVVAHVAEVEGNTSLHFRSDNVKI